MANCIVGLKVIQRITALNEEITIFLIMLLYKQSMQIQRKYSPMGGNPISDEFRV